MAQDYITSRAKHGLKVEHRVEFNIEYNKTYIRIKHRLELNIDQN